MSYSCFPVSPDCFVDISSLPVSRGLLRRFLRIYQSSSPSYLLMAGIDNALRYVGLQGQ